MATQANFFVRTLERRRARAATATATLVTHAQATRARRAAPGCRRRACCVLLCLASGRAGASSQTQSDQEG